MNKEIKIAVVVGIIMITACIIAVLIYNSNQKSITEINVTVLKLNTEGKDLSKYTESEILGMNLKYQKCSIATEDLVKINKEYKKMSKIGEVNKVSGRAIYGLYKITEGDNFVAFDNGGVFYKSEDSSIYNYNSDIYKLVADACK